MPLETYASTSARCHASSPIERPPGSARVSYLSFGSASSSASVPLVSRAHAVRKLRRSLFIVFSTILMCRSEAPTHFEITRGIAPQQAKRRRGFATKDLRADQCFPVVGHRVGDLRP